MKFYIPFHHDRISLNSKIALLLVGTMMVSLTLAGVFVYNSMRQATYHQYSEALAQIATVGTVAFDNVATAALMDPRATPAQRRRVRASLAKLWKQNRFDRSDRLGRLSLVLLDLPSRSISPYVWLGEKPKDGAEPPPEVWEAAARGTTVAEPIHALDGDWLRAWAPLPQTLSAGKKVILLQAEYSTSVVNYQLLRNLGSIVMACLAGLAVALVGSLWIANQVTKPLRAFSDVMGLMRDTDNFDIRIDLHPHDREMKVVERTFIALMKNVRDSRERVERSYLSTLQALVTALDIRDNETSGHSLRVMRYSGLIADRLRLGAELRDQVERGALLHDIGKIGVPDAILRKSGRLTGAEWKEMQKHPEIGRKLLEGIDFLEPAVPVVLCHHERWDGNGYPRSLRGEEIPMAARVFMVADALDTITSERYYKRASSFEVARKEIERSAGSHFDPAVVEAFLAIPVKTLRKVRSESTPRIDKSDLGAAPVGQAAVA